MFLESFRHLIEIEALKIQNQNDSAKITNENKRISDIEAQRNKCLQKKLLLEEEMTKLHLADLQKQIEQQQQQITRMKSQINLAVNEKEQMALESQIVTNQNALDLLVEKYFLSLTRQEEIEQEKKELDQFLAGSKISQTEIQNEVDQEILKYNQAINGRIQRIDSLNPLCQTSLLSLYNDLEKKFHPLRPVAYLVDKKCTQCHMLQNSTFKAAVEEGRSFESCPNCGRLLIPETAKIY